MRSFARWFKASTASSLSFNSTRRSPLTLSLRNWLRLLILSCSSLDSGFVFGRPGLRSSANKSSVVRSVCSFAINSIVKGVANSIAGNDTLAGREPLLVDGGDGWQEERDRGEWVISGYAFNYLLSKYIMMFFCDLRSIFFLLTV
ncbi:exported hypothetical protein [Xenorhabdus bovienii str. oregonense]|uniref:Uncharacterized protein n=1 Tax=Xenorhabdus bovienii str. oregonense TaxID=1398202 RepID=A0A077P6Q5_XENBV|nr:exported hypothetical protein [Xenorhabdus bovienii str. oregonense]